MTVHTKLVEYLAKLAGAKRVKDFRVLPGNSAPTWHYEKGWTKWKNGRPRKYTPAVSEVTVGQQWLAEQFPTEYAIMRIRGDGAWLMVDEDGFKAREERAHLSELAQEAAQRTIELANQLAERQASERSFEPESECLYA